MLIDIYAEAIQAGECSLLFNPAERTKRPRYKTARARLTFEVFQEVLVAAEANLAPWVANSMLLALLTGQRREDVANMRFRDFQGGYLHVIQGKTGARVKIPELLRLEVLGMSIADIKRRCRSTVVSHYLIHQASKFHPKSKGKPLKLDTISDYFKHAVRLTGHSWADATPPSFHELRSLSGRLYKAQGVDTKALLGHKSQKTSDTYHDARGHDWVVVETT